MEIDVMTKEGRKRLGKQFRSVRKAQGWDVAQVACMADVKESTIEKIEEGVFNVPLDVLTRVADVLCCDIILNEKEL